MLQEETTTLAKKGLTNLSNSNLHTMHPDHATLVMAIQAKMQELGLNATQLALKIGFSKSKVSEILNNRRPLSKRMAKALYDIGIDTEVLFKALIVVR